MIGKILPDSGFLITLKIQDANPQYQTESYKTQKAMGAAADLGATLVPKGQKVNPSVVDVE
jgi:hypothetical protein